jgi:hypothetical protein
LEQKPSLKISFIIISAESRALFKELELELELELL